MKDIVYWTWLGFKDARRAARTLFANVSLVVGVCVPLLLLLGLRRGLIEDFRSDITESPTAREIQAWATRDELRFAVGGGQGAVDCKGRRALVIPDITATAWLRGPNGLELEATLRSTVPGDPLLGFYSADILAERDRGIVITRKLAERMDISGGGPGKSSSSNLGFAAMLISRSGDVQRSEITVPIRAILDTGGQQGAVAYVGQDMMDMLEDFKKGRAVAELRLPSIERPAAAVYEGYLAFSKRPYESSDFHRLQLRGLTAMAIGTNDATDRHAWRRLLGLLRPHSLSVYWITSELGDSGLTLDKLDVEQITDSDDVVLPWVTPADYEIAGQPHIVIGVTARRRWLGSYFRSEQTIINEPATEYRALVNVFDSTTEPCPDFFELALSLNQAVPMRGESLPVAERLYSAPLSRRVLAEADALIAAVEPVAAWLPFSPRNVKEQMSTSELFRYVRKLEDALFAAPRERVAVVSAELAAHLTQTQKGSLSFDSVSGNFVPVAGENRYTRARIYAPTIEDVPATDAALKALGYGTTSLKTRVLEMLGYSRTLDIVVAIILVASLTAGIWTVLSAFWDLTHRKRGAIGVMKLMGAPPVGIFSFVFVRGLVVAALAIGLTAVLGHGAAFCLTWGLDAACSISGRDMLMVAGGALLCCLAGVAVPAIYAARSINPLEAIAASRVQ